MQKPEKMWEINQLFIFLGMLSIVFAVLKIASGIVVPLLIAMAIAIILSPLFELLARRRVPRVISLLLVLLIAIGFLVSVGAFIANEVQSFIANSATMTQSLQSAMTDFTEKLNRYQIPLDFNDLSRLVPPASIAGLLQSTLSQLGNQLSNILLIVFIAAFMTMDASNFQIRLEKVYAERGGDMGPAIEIIQKIKTYFLIKAKISLLTAGCAYLVLWYFDIQYAFLWAVVTFAMNFIPVIGSIIAAIPPVLFAMLDHSMSVAMLVVLWYAAINIVIGNIIEPGLMGRGLGLSTLTVFFSMTFWGWMFGPTGTILSVPLTMGFQFMLMQNEETRWAGFLLSDYKGETYGENDDAARAGKASGGSRAVEETTGNGGKKTGA